MSISQKFDQTDVFIPYLPVRWSQAVASHIQAFTTFNHIYINHERQDFNLAKHIFTADINNPNNLKNIQQVENNRNLLEKLIGQKVYYFKQTHSDICHDLNSQNFLTQFSTQSLNINKIFQQEQDSIEGDASFSHAGENAQACAVMTADCLPIFITDKKGKAYAMVHAGWKGILNGVIFKTVEMFLAKTNIKPEDILIAFGPAIGPSAFEVDADFKDMFLNAYPDIYIDQKKLNFNINFNTNINIEQLFRPTSEKYLADIYLLARLQLLSLGILNQNIADNHYCSFFDQRFYSHRRASKCKAEFKDELQPELKNNPNNNFNNFNYNNDGRMLSIIYDKSKSIIL